MSKSSVSFLFDLLCPSAYPVTFPLLVVHASLVGPSPRARASSWSHFRKGFLDPVLMAFGRVAHARETHGRSPLRGQVSDKTIELDLEIHGREARRGN